MSTFTDLTKSKITVNQLLFKHLYYRYNRFIAPLSTVLICIVLAFFVVIPQMQSWFDMRNSLSVNAQSLQVMHQNLSTITSLDSAKLDAALSIATHALPAEKDFTGVVSSLKQAAAEAGTSLGDYSFQVGNLSGTDAQANATQLPIQLSVTLRGGLATAQYFVAAVQRQLPLADALSVNVAGDSVGVTVVFYYSALPQIAFQDDRPLPVLSTEAQNLLNTLASNSQATFSIPSPSTPSATVSPTPTTPVLPTIPPTVTPATSSATATSSAQ